MQAELLEKRPLPVGMSEFDPWAERIIQATGLPASYRSMKAALAQMIIHDCGDTQCFKEDAFFVLKLRKYASNQIAQAVFEEIHKQKKLEDEQKLAEDTAPKLGVIDGGLLENKDLSKPQ